MAVIREKEVLTNLLRKYREFPCLWNRNDEHYLTKTIRSEALENLLKIYRIYEPKASLFELKKKLSCMRTCYRRSRVKVLKARAQGQEYEPILWYYDELKFLNETIEDKFTEYEQLEQEENEEEMEDVDYLKSESRSNSPPLIKRRRSSDYVFFNEDDAGCVNQADLSTIMDHSNYTKNNLNASSSTDSFGKTVASQLDELQPLQRYVAEKLISEVIFYARLDKLCPDTSITLKK